MSVATATFDEEVWETEEEIETDRMDWVSDRALIDARLFMAIQGVAFALCMTAPFAVWAFLAAAGAMLLSIAVRPKLMSKQTGFGAFEAEELGFMIWNSAARSMVKDRGLVATTSAMVMLAVTTVMVIFAGAVQSIELVLLAAVTNLLSLAAARHMLARLVLRDSN